MFLDDYFSLKYLSSDKANTHKICYCVPFLNLKKKCLHQEKIVTEFCLLYNKIKVNIIKIMHSQIKAIHLEIVLN